MSKNAKFIVGVCSAVALTLGACSDNKSSSDSVTTTTSLATAEMVPAIQALVTLAAAGPGESVGLTACPLGDFNTLVSKAPAEVQAIAAAADGDQLFAYVYQTEGVSEAPYLQCRRGDLGAYTGEVPGADYRQDLIGQLPDFVLTFDDDRDHRGGTIVRFCAEPIGVGGGEFCEADWYDGDVWVGVFLDGESRSSDLAEQWLIAILDDVVANVSQLAPSIQLASPTAAMVPAIQSLVTLAAAGPGESVSLTACPLGDFDTLVGKAPDEVQALATAAEGDLVTYVFQPDLEGEPAMLQCGRSELGAYTGEVPTGDYRDEIVNVLKDFIVTFDPDSVYHEGTIVRFCTEAIGVGGNFCEADWYDDNVWVGVFLSGDNQSTELAEQWLVAILDDVIANVPQLAPGIQVAA